MLKLGRLIAAILLIFGKFVSQTALTQTPEYKGIAWILKRVTSAPATKKALLFTQSHQKSSKVKDGNTIARCDLIQILCG